MKNQDRIFKEITDTIVANLENAGKWSKPWQSIGGGDVPQNAISGRPYSGINWLILGCAPYASQQWLTYKQATKIGGNVIKGSKGTTIVYFKMMVNTDSDGNESKYPMLKTYTVFNTEQCENLDMSKIKHFDPSENLSIHDSESAIKELIKQLNVNLQHGGDTACFIPSVDVVKMPYVNAFNTQAEYDSTLLHELTHWTGHSSRLNRIKGKAFATKDYAFEELVAELGSAMAGSMLGLPYEGLQHVDYIASWLERLKGDTKYIYEASKLASKAVNYMIDNATAIQLDEVA